MAYHSLSANFAYFFGRLNPSSTFEKKAAAHYAAVKGLIENRRGLASALAPTCFLQGSYRNETATYTINDVDIVALCGLWYQGSGSGSGWSRDQIFDTVAAPLLNDHRFRDRVRYRGQSMCIKLDVEPRIEILPVVYKAGNFDPSYEPFVLYRPRNHQWEDGFARYHRQWISSKNRAEKTANNFVPAIKVLKHLRTRFGLDAVSFHIECLLFIFPGRSLPRRSGRLHTERARTHRLDLRVVLVREGIADTVQGPGHLHSIGVEPGELGSLS